MLSEKKFSLRLIILALGISLFGCADKSVEEEIKNEITAFEAALRDLEAIWPGTGKYLSKDDQGRWSLRLESDKQDIEDLSPLKDYPLCELRIYHFPALKDLSAISHMPIEGLYLTRCPLLEDLSPVKSLKKLKRFHLNECPLIQDISSLEGKSLEYLGLNYLNKLSDLSPIQDMPLRRLSLYGLNLQEVSVLSSLTQLADFHFWSRRDVDLTPIQKLPIQKFDLWFFPMNDLKLLEEMPLESLGIWHSKELSDISQIEGKNITELKFVGCPEISNLEPLKGMKLKKIDFDPTRTEKGIDILRQMDSLASIRVNYTHYNGRSSTGIQKHYSSEAFWTQFDRGEFNL
ncbi:hypothetical protein P0Y35_12505 [Kiritimatiellaeota bacterium B1221]|nr:hypothetical protein [Kiritimatiellaeota bacterium B1221]